MRSPIGQHVMMRLEDGRVIATSSTAYRLAASALLAQGEARGLIAFRVVDSHVHALLLCDREAAGAFARYAGGSLSKRLGLEAPFSPARFEAVRSQSHLVNAFRYVLRQEHRHGVALDPFHDGSSLPELLGLRVVAPWLALRVRAHLPRLSDHELAALVGLDRLEHAAIATSSRSVADATAAAFALPAVDAPRTPTVVRARRAALHAAPNLSLAALATALGISRATAYRLRSLPPLQGDVRAVRLQSALRSGAREPSPTTIPGEPPYCEP